MAVLLGKWFFPDNGRNEAGTNLLTFFLFIVDMTLEGTASLWLYVMLRIAT